MADSEDISKVLSIVRSDSVESEVGALQLALKDNKILQRRVAEQEAEIRQLKSMVESMAAKAPMVITPQSAETNGLMALGHAIPKELEICESQIQLYHRRADLLMEKDDVKNLALLVETKLKILNNTLDLTKPNKDQIEKEYKNSDLTAFLKKK